MYLDFCRFPERHLTATGKPATTFFKMAYPISLQYFATAITFEIKVKN
jgi:hypothetical protein